MEAVFICPAPMNTKPTDEQQQVLRLITWPVGLTLEGGLTISHYGAEPYKIGIANSSCDSFMWWCISFPIRKSRRWLSYNITVLFLQALVSIRWGNQGGWWDNPEATYYCLFVCWYGYSFMKGGQARDQLDGCRQWQQGGRNIIRILLLERTTRCLSVSPWKARVFYVVETVWPRREVENIDKQCLLHQRTEE